MKERLITALFAGLIGAVFGIVAGWVLMEEKFPIYIFLGFTTTFGVIGFFAKNEWKEFIVDWILEKLS